MHTFFVNFLVSLAGFFPVSEEQSISFCESLDAISPEYCKTLRRVYKKHRDKNVSDDSSFSRFLVDLFHPQAKKFLATKHTTDYLRTVCNTSFGCTCCESWNDAVRERAFELATDEIAKMRLVSQSPPVEVLRVDGLVEFLWASYQELMKQLEFLYDSMINQTPLDEKVQSFGFFIADFMSSDMMDALLKKHVNDQQNAEVLAQKELEKIFNNPSTSILATISGLNLMTSGVEELLLALPRKVTVSSQPEKQSDISEPEPKPDWVKEIQQQCMAGLQCL